MFPITVVNKRHDGVDGELIDRSSPLGNPYPIGPRMTRKQALQQYRMWLRRQVIRGNPVVLDELTRLVTLAKQRPVVLVCSCKPKACHGDHLKGVLESILQSAEPWPIVSPPSMVTP